VIAGTTAIVKLANTKVLEKCSDNDDDYFNIFDKEYEIEVLIAPKVNENIRYTKTLLFFILLKARFALLTQNNLFIFEETLTAR